MGGIEGTTSSSQTTCIITGVNENVAEDIKKTTNTPATGIVGKIKRIVRTLKDNFTSGNRTVKVQENNDVAKAAEAVDEATEKLVQLKQNKGSEEELEVAEAQLKVAEVKMKIANQAFKVGQLKSKFAQLTESFQFDKWPGAKSELETAQKDLENMSYGELSQAQEDLNEALGKLETINRNSNAEA